MQSIRTRVIRLVVAACAALALCLWSSGPASAQYTGFEPGEGYNGAPEGVTLTGQQGWYLPVAGSADFGVYTHDGNWLALWPNYLGDLQFIGGQAPGGMTFRRAQQNFNWGSGFVWLVSYDVSHRFNGTLPAVDNLSSFSLQDSATTKSFIQLNRWQNLATATEWRAEFNVFTAAGAALDMQSPGAAWQNLPVNFPFRVYIVFDLVPGLNRIWYVGLLNLYTFEYADFSPPNWYLRGGEASALPNPTALRFFVGGGGGTDTGNVAGFDNLSIDLLAAPVPGFPPPNPFARAAAPRVPRPVVRPDKDRLVAVD